MTALQLSQLSDQTVADLNWQQLYELILASLLDNNPQNTEQLFAAADKCRYQHVGDAVFLRGLIEFSNICQRNCLYCGLRRDNTGITRYLMTDKEIVSAAEAAKSQGYGTVVLQSGENCGLTKQRIREIVRAIIDATGLTVTLSVGERTIDELKMWREAGASRYLLRFETAKLSLFKQIHPDAIIPSFANNIINNDKFADTELPEIVNDSYFVQTLSLHPRLKMLKQLRELDYEVGSGIMVGLPGQSYGDLAIDLLWFRYLQLDMIGIGPFLPHPDTPLGQIVATDSAATEWHKTAKQNLPCRSHDNSELLTRKVLSWTRLLCPDANIPATTALGTLNPQSGREHGLQCGANVLMPNCTPQCYRRCYEIYPAKICIAESEDDDFCQQSMKSRVLAIGRPLGVGAGNAKSKISKRESTIKPGH